MAEANHRSQRALSAGKAAHRGVVTFVEIEAIPSVVVRVGVVVLALLGLGQP